jgi:hypothetical protein
MSVIRCPSCRRALTLPDRLRTAPVQCPACGATFEAPGPPSPGPCHAAPPRGVTIQSLPVPARPVSLPVPSPPGSAGAGPTPPARPARKRLGRALLVLLPVALLGLALAQRAGNRQSLPTRRAAPPAARGLPAPAPARPGGQAVTIQVANVAAGVRGFVLPGRKVDVLLTVGEGPGDGTATTLLQNVEVLAVDQPLDGLVQGKADIKELRSVTLLVSPREASLLALGQRKGTLRLSLRNPDDKEAANPPPVTLRDLRFHQEKPWGQRLWKVLADFAKALAQELDKQPGSAPKPEPNPQPRPPLRIDPERRRLPPGEALIYRAPNILERFANALAEELSRWTKVLS